VGWGREHSIGSAFPVHTKVVLFLAKRAPVSCGEVDITVALVKVREEREIPRRTEKEFPVAVEKPDFARMVPSQDETYGAKVIDLRRMENGGGPLSSHNPNDMVFLSAVLSEDSAPMRRMGVERYCQTMRNGFYLAQKPRLETVI
jgi:hypothetical protein